MQLFKNNQQILSTLNEIPFKLEQEIQDIFEQNLKMITGWQFVVTELPVKANRFDTLAFDEESKAFIIIEYKRDRTLSVVDQGISYLNLLLEYKANFVLEYNERCNGNLRLSDVDWSQSRVVFVAPSFTDFQVQASNFKDLPIELWEIKQYEQGLILVNPIKKSKAAPSIKPLQQQADSVINKVTQEIIVYTEEDHLNNKSQAVKELYETYKEGILRLTDDVEIMPKKHYISFEKNKRIIADIVVQTQELKLYINTQYSSFQDLQNIGIQMNDKTKWGRGYYQIIIRNTDNLEYIMSLVKQAV